MDVLSDDWVPPRLLRREGKLEELRSLLRGSRIVVVEGISGAGKSTLVKKVGALVVDCAYSRTYAGLLRRLSAALDGVDRSVLDTLLNMDPMIIAFDDFTLVANIQCIKLVKRLSERHRVILVTHPWIKLPLKADKLIMPPYSKSELVDILADRVIRGGLSVSDEAIEYVSDVLGYPKGPGSARLAIATLRTALEMFNLVGVEQARYALQTLGLV